MREDGRKIAEGVWLVRGGLPRLMNVYLIADHDGVILFDAGIRPMAKRLMLAADALGGATRILLSHAHPDHRGAARDFGLPVWCHVLERGDVEGSAGLRYLDLSRLNPLVRQVLPRLWRRWDAGPVQVERTVEEGEQVAGFEVLHTPGHAPGMIALWRPKDRLVLSADCFFTINIQTGLKGRPRVPPAVMTEDPDQARASMIRMAALDPGAAWPSHGGPLLEQVGKKIKAATRRG